MPFDIVAATKEGHILRSRNKDRPDVCIVRSVKCDPILLGVSFPILNVGVMFYDKLLLEGYILLASRTLDRHWKNVTLNAYARKIQQWWRRALHRRDAALRIQRAWRSVIANSNYVVYKRRLLREFLSLNKLQRNGLVESGRICFVYNNALRTCCILDEVVSLSFATLSIGVYRLTTLLLPTL